jgi:hypothetical protein
VRWEAKDRKIEVKGDNPQMIKRMIHFCYTGDYHSYKPTPSEIQRQKDTSGVLAHISINLDVYTVGDKYNIPLLQQTITKNLASFARKYLRDVDKRHNERFRLSQDIECLLGLLTMESIALITNAHPEALATGLASMIVEMRDHICFCDAGRERLVNILERVPRVAALVAGDVPMRDASEHDWCCGNVRRRKSGQCLECDEKDSLLKSGSSALLP